MKRSERLEYNVQIDVVFFSRRSMIASSLKAAKSGSEARRRLSAITGCWSQLFVAKDAGCFLGTIEFDGVKNIRDLAVLKYPKPYYL